MRIFIFIAIILLFSGCINKQGVSLNYYDNCKSYYDLFGVYHEECNDNIIYFNKKKSPPSMGVKECLECN
jgi:hypothetical protein